MRGQGLVCTGLHLLLSHKFNGSTAKEKLTISIAAIVIAAVANVWMLFCVNGVLLLWWRLGMWPGWVCDD